LEERMDFFAQILKNKILLAILYPVAIAAVVSVLFLYSENKILKYENKKMAEEVLKLQSDKANLEESLKGAIENAENIEIQCKRIIDYEKNKPKTQHPDTDIDDKYIDDALGVRSQPGKAPTTTNTPKSPAP
jgi:hypothetical protein